MGQSQVQRPEYFYENFLQSWCLPLNPCLFVYSFSQSPCTDYAESWTAGGQAHSLTGFGVNRVGRQMFNECYRRENKDALGARHKGTYPNLESGKPHPRTEDEGWLRPGEGRGEEMGVFQEKHTTSSNGQDRVTKSSFKAMTLQD